jgi:hypothetical protein
MAVVATTARILLAQACLWAGATSIAHADETGASFWLSGSYASQAAVPVTPGFSVETTFYHATANAGRTVDFTRGGRIELGLDTVSNYFLVTPSYAFETPVVGGQLALGVTFLAGNYSSTVSATLVAPSGESLSGASSDAMTGLGDLYPFASLKWNRGVHNFMAYVTAGIPSGAYDPNRQSTVGLGHWAVDGGGGYTYYDETKGHEFSAVLGFTYNFMNPSTLYQSGIDLHLELSASQYLTERLYAGAVGYFYNQITADSGPGASLGPFMARVAGAGPQAGYDFVLGRRDASLNVRGYYEFAGENRPQGWNAWVTLVIALGAPGKPAAAARRTASLP